MKRLLFVVLLCGLGATASADVWRWVDKDGKTHFVDTDTPIFTWTDEFGAHHYSDTPDHEDAIAVELVWHSKGTLQDLADALDGEDVDEGAYPGETEEERYARKQAEAYYCKRANEIYESYANAPQLYRTNENGEREYLSKAEKAKTLKETKAKRDELCS